MPFLQGLKPKKPLNKPSNWPSFLFKDKAHKHVVIKMQLDSLSKTPSPLPPDHKVSAEWEKKAALVSSKTDLTTLLSDELLLRVFSKLPDSQRNPNSLVCKRWLHLQGRLVHSVKLLDWDFLFSGRLLLRFPNLTDVDLVAACIDSPRSSGILLTHKFLSVHLDSDFSPCEFVPEKNLLPPASIDGGLRVIAQGCPNLRKLVLNAATESGLSSVAEECPTLQELELHRCTDVLLRGISACKNLQILKLIGTVDGFYSSVVSDIGLTFLANGCKRLVKLELSGCEGSYDGIKAIGQCCHMLEELTLCDHRMDGGWMAALSFCGNLKTLKLQSCKRIDLTPGPDEHLGSLRTLERLQLQRCQLRDQQSMKSLMLICEAVREMVFQDCWGLDNEMFSFASHCRRVKFLSLEGCSLLNTDGLESVLLSWKELQRLRVVSCNNIKDSEVTPALSSLFSVLKELKWRPDSQSLLLSGLAGSGVGKKGDKFFKRL
ncbi:F-box protein At5g51370-like [Telopea speciosissima]|uniref:F-box protein At5g51370-like n=1 Tax=Telopea speciosissima TaxID=54955 RepID=UPI001CC77456|nr:F-box protein At5g51370-like [Telopea speciosissima]